VYRIHQSACGDPLRFRQRRSGICRLAQIHGSAALARCLLILCVMTPAELRERLGVFASDVAKFAAPLLDRPVTYDVARQLIRSAASAADHHRAAGRARSHAEFTAKIGVALDEVDEARSWLEYLHRTEFVPAAHLKPFRGEAQELVAILSKSHATARRRRDRPPPRVNPRPRRRRGPNTDGQHR
jgi:four helix bundle protein